MKLEDRIKTEIHLHPAFVKVTNKLTQYIDEGLLQQDGDRQTSLKWILGPSRCGKSQALETVHSKYKGLETLDASGRKIIPVLKVTMRSGGSKGGLANAILEALGMDLFARGTASDKFNLAIRQLTLFQVKVLLIDEIQQMTDAGRSVSVRGAADVLKELYERMRISIVFIGLPNAAELYKSNTQLANRSEQRVLFMPYDFSNENQFKEFLISTKGFYETLEVEPHLIPVNFRTFARALYYLSAGRFGVVCNYMHNLNTVLRRSKDLRVTVDKLDEAAQMTAVDFDLITNIFTREISDQEFSIRWQQVVRAENIESLVDVRGLIAAYV